MKKLMVGILILLGGAFGCPPVITGEVGQKGWPEIKPIDQSFHFIKPSKTEAIMRILAPDGTPFYMLECRLGPHEDPDFDYSGDFECRLTSLYSREAYSTLLTENREQSRDWQSRARFLVEELIGKCAEYPEYGKVRSFRLRGMRLTLTIKNLKLQLAPRDEANLKQRGQIKELDLSVAVIPDPTALSNIAEPAQYIEPPYAHPKDPQDMSRNCENVLKR